MVPSTADVRPRLTCVRSATVSGDAIDLLDWSHGRVARECRAAYRSFHAKRRAVHIAYFASRPAQRSANPKRPFEAAELRWAFPPALERLADQDIGWHTHAKSGGSSQVLAISLLQPATEADPSLSWLFEPLGTVPSVGMPSQPVFEFGLSPELLNESPHVTSLDWLVEGELGVLVAEAKFMEEGLGVCSCAGQAKGDCSDAVRARPYWRVARDYFGWDGPHPPEACPLSLAYQAVRNVAAALALAGRDRRAVWLLLYDAENPYFSGAGEWPGWVAALKATLAASDRFEFCASSWQELLQVLPLPENVTTWVTEKHSLAASD
jgi:hypothetical protein